MEVEEDDAAGPSIARREYQGPVEQEEEQQQQQQQQQSPILSTQPSRTPLHPQQQQPAPPPAASSTGARWLKLDTSGARKQSGATTTPTVTPARSPVSEWSPSRAWRSLGGYRDVVGKRDKKNEPSKFGTMLRLGGSPSRTLPGLAEGSPSVEGGDDGVVRGDVGASGWHEGRDGNATPTVRVRRNTSLDRWDMSPSAGSAGREGRQFSVSGVGNKGRIYIRPMVRPAHMRYPQPNFVFPLSAPPLTGEEAPTLPEQPPPLKPEPSPGLMSNLWSPTTSTPEVTSTRHGPPPTATRPVNRRRAMSESNAKVSNPGDFRVVISKSGHDSRATAGAGARAVRHHLSLKLGKPIPAAIPAVDVAIPSWRLGSPRFSALGIVIQGSSYAPTEAEAAAASAAPAASLCPSPRVSPRVSQRISKGLSLRSSDSRLSKSASAAAPPSIARTSAPSSLFVPPLTFPGIESAGASSPLSPKALRFTYVAPVCLVIEPAMFDPLTFKPDCDDRRVVRYSASLGAIIAATPARLVAEITSPDVVDYELLSDFFLTYRYFLKPRDLLQMLIARWRWGLQRDDELGTVSRVRTFVAVRHWILNYFTDDFLDDHALRVDFCDLVNQVMRELSDDERVRKVQVKVLGELKKCWRRVCAQFWDGEEFDDNPDLFAPLTPGAAIPHGNSDRTSSFEYTDEGRSQIGDVVTRPIGRDRSSFLADVSRSGLIDETILGVSEARPSTPLSQPDLDEVRKQAASPTSLVSVEAVSCSFPGKAMRIPPSQNASHLLAAHPVAASSVMGTAALTVATTPRSLVGKRVRPTHGHNQSVSLGHSHSHSQSHSHSRSHSYGHSRSQSQGHNKGHRRNNSRTDSLRGPIPERPLPGGDQEAAGLAPLAGSLVRGNLRPPSQAYVDVAPPSIAGEAEPQRAGAPIGAHSPRKDLSAVASAMSGPGMRKLIGSVRRALTKTPGAMAGIRPRSRPGTAPEPSPTQASFIGITPLGPRGVTVNRLPGTPVVPQSPVLQQGRPPVRIDLLGAEVAAHFKKAVQEELQAAEARKKQGTSSRAQSAIRQSGLAPSIDFARLGHDSMAARSSSLPPSQRQTRNFSRPLSGAATNHSQSMAFYPGAAVPTGVHAMSGALALTANGSTPSDSDEFLEAMVPRVAGPTPPTTPPDGVEDPPQRSSYLMNQLVMQPAMSDETSPLSDLSPVPGPFRVSEESGRGTGKEPEPPAPAPSPTPGHRSPEIWLDPESAYAAPRPSEDSSVAPSIAASYAPSWAPSWAPSFIPSYTPSPVMDRASPAPGPLLRTHRRLPTSRARDQSLGSVGHRRCASFHSGMDARSASRLSFADSFVSGDVDEDEGGPSDEPVRMLRRRPGGDLRAVRNVGDLDTALRRPRSLSSLTTYSESYLSSYTRSPTPAEMMRGAADVSGASSRLGYRHDAPFSIGAMAEPPRRRLPDFDRHSSRPMMRPSFEIEAQKLALIPDDDDGSPESALLKLEGKYVSKTHRLTMEPRRRAPSPLIPDAIRDREWDLGLGLGDTGRDADAVSNAGSMTQSQAEAAQEEKKHHRHLHVANDAIIESTFVTEPVSESASESGIGSVRGADDLAGIHVYGSVNEDADEGDTTMRLDDEDRFSLARPPSAAEARPAPPPSFSESYVSALPFRGKEDGNGDEAAAQGWTLQSVLRDENDDDDNNNDDNDDDDDSNNEQSFLRDEPDEAGGSELSSEMSAAASDNGVEDASANSNSNSDSEGQRLPIMDPGATARRSRPPLGPLGAPLVPVPLPLGGGGGPPSPPMTLAQTLGMPTDAVKPRIGILPPIPPSQTRGWDKASPPTTPLTPTPTNVSDTPRAPAKARKATMSGQKEQPSFKSHKSFKSFRSHKSHKSQKSNKTVVYNPEPVPALTRRDAEEARLAAHLPFILAFESEILAQQFTLIEKDALNDIDWKELIDMAWRNSAHGNSRSWVDFLRNSDARGVEVVIARFNIMVKWAVSEIVLTRDVEERARCVTKYIHIASHCRRHRNFATLSQITIALTSKEVSSLARTWALVPAADVRTLHELEQLVSPTRNFFALRAEMEVGTEAACIPFVGIYTQDLLFNAQRPSEMPVAAAAEAAAPGAAAPLVNFERCRIAAGVVKTVLRLLEASTLYDFEPIEGVTERCLWMGALSDDEIRMHAATLE